MAKKTEYEVVEVEGHELHLFRNPRRLDGRLILYLHGGGYMFGPFPPEWKMAWSIAADTESDLAVFLYPRTPEHQAEHTVEVTLTAYQALLDRIGVDSVVLVGTSAGGGLGVVLMVEAAKRDMQLPSVAVLVSPAVDMTLRDGFGSIADGDVVLSSDYVRLAGLLYAGDLATDHPWVSPTNGNLEGLPPLQVFAGSREILSPSIENFVDRVRAAGSSPALIFGEGQQHTWPTLSTPEGQQALDAMTSFIVGATD
jgi:acetyl esterase/lipase